MPAMTRGPLPSSIYWRRRLIVITVVLVIVAVALKVFGHGGGTAPKAAPTAQLTTQSSPASPGVTPPGVTSPGVTPTPDATPTTGVTPTVTPTPTAPPTPSGPCAASDVTVTPSVTAAVTGTPVPIVLTLQTTKTPACTWEVSRKTVQVKVTSASGAAVWSTVQCPKAVPTSEVVVYRDTPTTVQVDWSARRADDDCSTHTAWSKAGSYQVTAVALGGEPSQATFALGLPGSVPPPAPSTPATTPTAPATGTTPSTTPTAPATADSSTSPAQPKKHRHKKKHPIVD